MNCPSSGLVKTAVVAVHQLFGPPSGDLCDFVTAQLFR